MKSPLFPALLLGLLLIGCERSDVPPAAVTPPAPPSPPADDSGLREARDALARQAMDIETRSALLDKQLAELEARLQQSENETLRGQLDQLKQQNDQLRTQADSARKQSDALTQRLTAAAPAPVPGLTAPATPRDLSLFYERLAPHGRWIDVSGHGLCFQPRMARNRTWRPYVDGCWSWSSLGWTWQTSEPFGWATYHYGRWVNLTTHGWLWVPGCEWAPAWVAWRQSRDHIGWAPLPPESSACDTIRRDCDTRYRLGPASYTFVRTTHFVRPSYTTCIQPVSYNSTIFQHTVNVTQIVPCGDRHSPTPLYMHHGGPPRDHIEQACRQPVPQTQIRPVEPAQITLKPAPLDTSQGVTPIIGIVQLPAAAENKLHAVQPAERIERPIVANPFAGVPVAARASIQQTMEAEARQIVLADSPRQMPSNPTPDAPATAPESTPIIPLTAATPTEPQPALTANLSAPIENRGSQPQSTPPSLPLTPPEQPALVVTAPPLSSEGSIRSHMAAPSVPSPTEPPQPPTVVTLPPAETPPASPEPAATPVISPAPDEAARAAAAQQQAQMAAAQQQQAEDATRRAAEEETARQAQMQAQQQAAAERQAQEAAQQQAQMETQRQAAEEAQRQAQMEAQRQAEEAARRAAEEAQRQAQMESQRQAEEAARRAAEEAQRQAQMEAQRQAEEAARRAAEEAQRQAQMEAQRQAEEAARRAAEEAARQAAQQPTPPPQ